MREVLTVPAVIHPMPVEAADLNRSAAGYAASLPASFDLVQLGLGADGHTASLVPGDPVLDATTDVAVTQPYQSSWPGLSWPSTSSIANQDVDARHEAGHDEHTAESPLQTARAEVRHRRMTLTFAPINRARSILWIVTGAAKRDALAALLDGKAGIPANRVARDQAIVVADRAAAG